VEPQRARRYERIFDQLRDLIADRSPNLVAAMATTCALLHAKMPHHSWTGFYFVANDGTLHVGPYQGPVACQILEGRGVCLHAAVERRAIVVPDVSAFPGHIACDPRSRSEIAIPMLRSEDVVAVFDIDATEPDQFTEDDVAPLERILALLTPWL